MIWNGSLHLPGYGDTHNAMMSISKCKVKHWKVDPLNQFLYLRVRTPQKRKLLKEWAKQNEIGVGNFSDGWVEELDALLCVPETHPMFNVDALIMAGTGIPDTPEGDTFVQTVTKRRLRINDMRDYSFVSCFKVAGMF